MSASIMYHRFIELVIFSLNRVKINEKNGPMAAQFWKIHKAADGEIKGRSDKHHRTYR